MLKRNLPQNLNDLRSGCISPKKFIKYQHVTNDLIKRLKLTKELVGHNGCVNCLEWNETGELLASGSDDTHLMIWDSFNYKRVADIDTCHKGNIFSVKFMPKFNNAKLASGAGDSCVKVIDISQETTIDNYLCHQNRVKRLAVSYNEPYLLWSCSEDGTIRQFDIRENTNSQNNVQSNNVLINLNSHIGPGCEVKCLAINPVRSDQLAVGSNDQYIRLYDRRKLNLKSFDNYDKKNKGLYSKLSNGTTPLSSSNENDMKSIPDDAVQYYVPSHIPWGNQTEKYMPYTCTYLTFSPDGNSLLVNMGSEQVYLYDVNKNRPSFSFQSSLAKHVSTCDCDLICDYSDVRNLSNDIKSSINYTTNLSDVDKESGVEMLPHLNILKDQGNQMYKNSEFHSAITYYNIALQQGGNIHARFYANRAAAYISRNWAGDIYAALQDSIKALEIDYFHIKSHFRIAQCLFQLNMIAEANDYIKYFQFMFPDEAKKIKQVGELEKKIVDKISDIINKEHNENSKENPANGSKHSNKDVKINILEAISKHMKTQRFLEKKLGEQELRWRIQSNDYVNRFCGHCNTTTDIKEANFFGINGQYIMAGSDEGNIFFWDRANENIIRVVCGDRNIVNCLQPHPTICFLASSGIDSVIRLWSPSYDEACETSDDEMNKIGTGQNVIKAAQCNQKRIKSDPIENMLRNWGYHTIFAQNSDENEDGNDADGSEDNHDTSNTTPRRGLNHRHIQFDNAEYCRTS